MIVLERVELINSQVGLEKLIKFSEEKKLSFRLGYKTTKLVGKIGPQLKAYEEKRTEVFERYGEEIKTDDGSPKRYNIKSENIPDANDAIEVLLTEKVELDNVFKYETSELSSVDLSIGEIVSLLPIIDTPDTKVAVKGTIFTFLEAQVGLQKLNILSENKELKFAVKLKTAIIFHALQNALKDYLEFEKKLVSSLNIEIMVDQTDSEGVAIQEEVDGVFKTKQIGSGQYDFSKLSDTERGNYTKQISEAQQVEEEISVIPFTQEDFEDTFLSVKEITTLVPLIV